MPDEKPKSLFYSPQPPERFNAEAAAKLAPNDPARTILSAIASAAPMGEAVVAVADKLGSDKTLSDEGRRLAREAVFADTVTAGVGKFTQAIDLADKRADELAAKLLRDAIAKVSATPATALALQIWLRDLKPEDRQREIFDAHHNGDAETVAAAVNGPLSWKLMNAALRQRCIAMLIERHDPAKAAEIADLKTLVAVARESFESLIRFSRDALKLQPPPARPARKQDAAA